jgi:hypothetical protein
MENKIVNKNEGSSKKNYYYYYIIININYNILMERPHTFSCTFVISFPVILFVFFFSDADRYVSCFFYTDIRC